MSEVVILHAPSPLGLKPPSAGQIPGVRKAPAALRSLGLHAGIGARVAGEVEPPPYDFNRDPTTRLRNAAGVAKYSKSLSEAVAPLLSETSFPLVLGGDCSIALGVADALSKSGRHMGLLYIDAHSDCQTPEISQTGGIAGMPLAMITGAIPSVVAPSQLPSRQLSASDVILLGVRDLFDVEAAADGKRVVNNGIRVRDLDEIRRLGASTAASKALADLSSADATWVHLDADVLAPEIMPAVDSPDPGGLTEVELGELLRTLLSSPNVMGMHVTIYDPERDPNGSAGRLLVRVLTSALSVLKRKRLDA